MSDSFDNESKVFYKKLLIKYGILTGIIAVIFGLLVLFCLISRGSWKRGLSAQVNSVLERCGEEYRTFEWIPSDNGFSDSASFYSLSAGEQGREKDMYAVIIRVTTIYGPLPAVFVYNAKSDSSSFAGFADLEGPVADKMTAIAEPSVIEFWKKRIPSIAQTLKHEKAERL